MKKTVKEKTLFNQCKDLCNSSNPTALVNYEKLIDRVITRLQQWTLFGDDEIMMTANALKLMTNTPALINLMPKASLAKILGIFTNEDFD